MKSVSAIAIFLASLTFGACSPSPVFAPEVMEGIDQEFDFSRWRALPNQDEGKKVELGGAILQSDVKGDTVTLVLRQLPIVKHPAYGPKDTGKRSGEFAATFSGTLEPKFLQRGNRVVVIGTTKLAKVVVVDDIPRSLPNLEVKCLHIWNTGGREIADFPSFGAGYETLENQTWCASK